MSGIPLCRASQVLPFTSWLEEQGVPVIPSLRSVGLSEEPAIDPDSWIAELPIWRFCDRVVRTQGINGFGLRVGLETEVAEIGAFGRALSGAATLRSGLETFLRDLRRHSSNANFALRRDGDAVWFQRAGIPGVTSDAIEQYVVGVMIRIVRLVAGPDWVPDRIHLQAAAPPGEFAAEMFAESRIGVHDSWTAIRFPASMLSRPLVSPDSAALEHREHSYGEVSTDEFAGSLRLALESVLAGGVHDMNWAATVANTSPRTVRRRLAGMGVTWTELVEQTRFDLARRLLADPDVSIGEVANQVGYSDPANFTRAFRRWTGEAPSRYRGHC